MKIQNSILLKIFASQVFLLVAGCLSMQNDNAMSLVPSEASESPHAWCSWWTQNYQKFESKDKSMFDGAQGAIFARENINDSTVFAKGGWLEDWGDIRKDLYFIFDDGWDVKPNIDKRTEVCQFGSLEVNEQKFPSCADKSPAERLRKLNDAVKAKGWKGAGLWIAAQSARAKASTPLRTPEEERLYWKSRVLWCKHAKINYWKLDWGIYEANTEFRKMLTDLANEFHPDLIIEHSIPQTPVNDIRVNVETNEIEGSGIFANTETWRLVKIRDLLKFSQYTRVYDTIPPLTIVTTVDRTAWYLQEGEKLGGKGLLNLEDEMYTGAGLGCALGVMRSKRWGTPKSDEVEKAAFKLTETVRAARWSRIAPPFALSEGKTLVSENRLDEKWTFDDGETWWKKVWGKTLYQSAPAVVARNLPLPKVSVAGGEKLPYVVASVHPNGSVAVATRPRLYDGKGLFTPLADIEVDVNIENKKVGLFGKFKSVSFKLFKKPTSILAQDLAKDSSVEIVDECKYSDGVLKISGAIMDKLCLPDFEGDVSDPAIVFIVK